MPFPKLMLDDLEIATPIIQGGMGVGISLSGLASAVANAGGIGVIAGAMIGMKESDISTNPVEANIRALRTEIQKAHAQTNGVIGVNVMVALTTFTEMVKVSIEEKVNVIFAGAGLPLEMPKVLLDLCEQKKEEFKTKLVPIVSSARAASLIAKKWLARYNYAPDAFVVEGPKAGGHLGFKANELDSPHNDLSVLIPQVVDAAKAIEDKIGRKVPVIAAGGIFTGEDIYKIMQLGASGVQMGTRFVATHECDADIAFKEAYVNASEDDVTIIQSPVGMPGRALKGTFIDESRSGKTRPFKCVFKCVTTCEQEQTPYCIAMALISAMRGNLKRGFAFCGANVGKVNEIISVQELFQKLEAEYEQAVKLALK